MTPEQQTEAEKLERDLRLMIIRVRSDARNNIIKPKATYYEPLLARIERLVVDVKIEENESLLSVAEHEIKLSDHCDMHDKYSSPCHACKKRKWYGEINKDWKRIIEIRLKELTAQQEENHDH